MLCSATLCKAVLHRAALYYAELRTAAIKVQAAVRCSQARTAYEVTSSAAIVVQTAWKLYSDQKSQQQQEEEEAAAKIQACYRMHIRNIESTMSDTTVTAMVQHTEAATQIQRACRGWAGRKRASRELRNIVSIQVCILALASDLCWC